MWKLTCIIGAIILAVGIAYAGKNIGIGLIRFGESVNNENYNRKRNDERRK